MKKIILIDGNNFLFRSFFATMYTGNIMKTKDSFPTNALYGFVRMLNKIIEEEKPSYMVVAFDIGKNFRELKYPFYKEGRDETPHELKVQFPKAKELLNAMGIKYLELEPYEADDIIGTLVKLIEEDDNFDATIISSDKDLLQLINFETDVKLLKKDSYIRYDELTFKEEYGMDPIKIIDLKALMGDASDNIPGVKGVGEITALKLLKEYQSLDNVYKNIDNIKGALKDKLINDKENAYISYDLATIYKDVPLDIKLEDLKYEGHNDDLIKLYDELEFQSLKRTLYNEPEEEIVIKEITNIKELVLEDRVSLYIESDNENYHYSKPLGIGISDAKNNYYLDIKYLKDVEGILSKKEVVTYDIKKHLNYLNLNYVSDVMMSGFLLNYPVKEDVTSIMDNAPSDIYFNNLKKNKFNKDDIKKSCILKTNFIYKKDLEYNKEIKELKLDNIYKEIDIPLSYVLFDMEKEGIKCNSKILDEIKEELSVTLNKVTKEIHDLSGEEFNISSPKQLGDILFEKLKIASGKRNKTGYKTDAQTLEKLIEKHPIINKILVYRHITKLISTYIDGIKPYINEDEIIRPIFKQTLARTGRLSCTEPNLQNIPIRDEEGRKVRKAFIPKNDFFISADYSQIELRILAHISEDEKLVSAFKNDEDIHTRVAADIHGIKESEVSKETRDTAKAVIFGIVYGISGFGLGENLKITRKEADDFIKKYYEFYPNVKKYMDDITDYATKHGEVKTIHGRIRKITEISSNNYMVRQMGKRMALNTPMQGTSADIIKIAMINIFNDFKKHNLKSKLILQIHDELIFDVFKDEEDKLIKIVKDNMENVIKLLVPLKVNIKKGNNWFLL